jgi:hypothetical protein
LKDPGTFDHKRFHWVGLQMNDNDEGEDDDVVVYGDEMMMVMR